MYIPIPERGRQSAEVVVAHDISVHKMLVIQRSSVFSPAEAQFARFPKDRYFSLTAFDFFSEYAYYKDIIGAGDSNSTNRFGRCAGNKAAVTRRPLFFNFVHGLERKLFPFCTYFLII